MMGIGARGRRRADINAIADTLVKISDLALELRDQVAELDINPLLVLPEGQGVRVADALVIKSFGLSSDRVSVGGFGPSIPARLP